MKNIILVIYTAEAKKSEAKHCDDATPAFSPRGGIIITSHLDTILMHACSNAKKENVCLSAVAAYIQHHRCSTKL
jgi:hypothetical protein